MTWEQIKEKCTIELNIELFIGLFSPDWFYLLPTIKCMKTNKYYEIEFAFLSFFIYTSFSKHEDDL